MRLIAFASLSDHIRDRTKTVTRRRGWTFLQPGDHLQAVVGLWQPAPLAVLRVESVRREPLGAVTLEDVAREGFPDLDVPGFLAMFRAAYGSGPNDVVTRIEFSYVPQAVRTLRTRPPETVGS